MKKQSYRLLLLSSFLIGLFGGLLIRNTNILAALVFIPTGYVFYRGLILDTRINKIMDEITKKQ
jgi:hypothetical protein